MSASATGKLDRGDMKFRHLHIVTLDSIGVNTLVTLRIRLRSRWLRNQEVKSNDSRETRIPEARTLMGCRDRLRKGSTATSTRDIHTQESRTGWRDTEALKNRSPR